MLGEGGRSGREKYDWRFVDRRVLGDGMEGVGFH